MVAVMASVGTSNLAADTVIPDAIKTHLQTLLNNGLSGGLSSTNFSGGNSAIGQAITQVFDDAITQGAKWAAFTAGVFVSLGALASLFLPNVKPQWGEQSGGDSSSWGGAEGSPSSQGSGENQGASNWGGGGVKAKPEHESEKTEDSDSQGKAVSG
jgi:hypothetical protein